MLIFQVDDHLGHYKEFLPLQHGFDEYFGLPYSNDMWPVDFAGNMIPKDYKGDRPWKLNYPQLLLIEGNEKIEEIRTLEDRWSIVTTDGKNTAQFEHTVAIFGNRTDVLTKPELSFEF